MDRIYTALLRLASATLVIGLIFLVMITLNSGQIYPNLYISWQGPFTLTTGTIFDILRFAIPQLLPTIVTYLMNGVAFLGIIVAWVDGRRVWMLALIVTAAAALVFPLSFVFAGSFFVIHPRIGQFIGQNATFLTYLLSLFPVALALVMARLQGGGRAAVRVEADAALEITRSSL